MDAMQLDLFGNPAPPPPPTVRVHQKEKVFERKYPERKPRRVKATSLAARDSMRERQPINNDRVLAYIKGQGGATRDAISEGLDMKIQSVCPAVVELMKRGLIEETKDRRLTRSGRNAYVLRATEK